MWCAIKAVDAKANDGLFAAPQIPAAFVADEAAILIQLFTRFVFK